MSVNKVMLLGRLGQDPDLKYTQSGIPVANFTMATSDRWTDKNGQRQEKTEWHRITVWSKMAEVVSTYLFKGSEVFVEGKLQTRSWEDQNGQKKYMTEIVANNVQFTSGSPSKNAQGNRQQGPTPQQNGQAPQGQSQQGQAAQQPPQAAGQSQDFTADDIPF